MIINWGKWSDFEVVIFPETEQNAWLSVKILSSSVGDDEYDDLVGRVICGIKLLEKRCAINSGSKILLLNLYGFIDGCL